MKYNQKQESFVCIGDMPVRLRYQNVNGPVSVYQYDYEDGMKRIDYIEGKDYIIQNGLPLNQTNKRCKNVPLICFSMFVLISRTVSSII